MKYHYMSEREFFLKCPCGYNLRSYVETLVPPNSLLDFVCAEKSDSDENTYNATYDVIAPDQTVSQRLEVSCTELPHNTAQYKVIGKH